MITITAPSYEDNYEEKPAVFLAGGITGCWEWQKYVLRKLVDTDLVVYNPRRDNFPIGDPNAGKEQIAWKNWALDRADIFSIWFAADQIQPISLFELGKHIERRKWEKDLDKVAVGMSPSYPRQFDVEQQMSHSAPNLTISYTLDGHIEQIKDIYNNCFFGSLKG